VKEKKKTSARYSSKGQGKIKRGSEGKRKNPPCREMADGGDTHFRNKRAFGKKGALGQQLRKKRLFHRNAKTSKLVARQVAEGQDKGEVRIFNRRINRKIRAGQGTLREREK